MTAKTVIFACVHNAGRSQMAAAFFNALADPAQGARGLRGHAARASASTPRSRRAMRELGIDLVGREPQQLTDELAQGLQG